MRKSYFAIVYVVLVLAALVVSAGAPIPWSGTGGGKGISSLLGLGL
ncbi:MAG: hypothetical protein R6X16_07635 [Anaerolineae bacterium]